MPQENVLVHKQTMKINKLITTLTIGLVLILFLLPTILAINATTSTYTVGSDHQGSSGENGSTATYGSRSTTTFQQGSNDNGTTSTYNFNLGWFGTTATAAEEDTPAETGAISGAGGGGSSSLLSWARSLFDDDEDCESEWDCADWEDCENDQQRRYCSDANDCSEPTSDAPDMIRDCGTGSSGDDDDDDDTSVDGEEYGTDTYSGSETDGIQLDAEGNPIETDSLTTEKSKKSSFLKYFLIIIGLGLALGIAYYILKKAMKKGKSF
jgi:hypothetical protein